MLYWGKQNAPALLAKNPNALVLAQVLFRSANLFRYLKGALRTFINASAAKITRIVNRGHAFNDFNRAKWAGVLTLTAACAFLLLNDERHGSYLYLLALTKSI